MERQWTHLGMEQRRGRVFKNGSLNATTQTIQWCVIFFIASPAASSAYLTVSEIFPLEVRAKAISLFFAVPQFFGGVIAPFLFGKLIGAPRAQVRCSIAIHCSGATRSAPS